MQISIEGICNYALDRRFLLTLAKGRVDNPFIIVMTFIISQLRLGNACIERHNKSADCIHPRLERKKINKNKYQQKIARLLFHLCKQLQIMFANKMAHLLLKNIYVQKIARITFHLHKYYARFASVKMN